MVGKYQKKLETPGGQTGPAQKMVHIKGPPLREDGCEAVGVAGACRNRTCFGVL